jgi:mono/diheme cytochrome c family protein
MPILKEQRRTLIMAGATMMVIAGVALQATPTVLAAPAQATEPPWSTPAYREMFMRSCGDCHSNETKWPWYSQLPIVSGFIRNHVEEGRKELNVSAWGTMMQGEHTDEVAEVVQKGEMPPASYLFMHPEARLDAAAVQSFVQGANATFGLQESGEGKENEENEESDSEAQDK